MEARLEHTPNDILRTSRLKEEKNQSVYSKSLTYPKKPLSDKQVQRLTSIANSFHHKQTK